MDPKKFEQSINNLEDSTKKALVNGYTELSADWEIKETILDKKNFDKIGEENKNKIDDLLTMLYENLGWLSEDMDFRRVGYKQKFELLQSIYTIIQLRRPFLGKPYLECHKCGGRIRRQGDKFSLPQCDKCGLIMNFDSSIINL